MKTAVYTICKNELKFVDKWLFYGQYYDYRVLLDTGSTDGTWERLQECTSNDPNLIIEQKIITPWHFSEARNYNLDMVPKDVDWCLSPDLDEYFTKNTLDELKIVSQARPDMTNLACDRFDVYSSTPRVGPPNFLPSNKIHKRHDYIWVQPIYEHLRWNHPSYETELYSSNIYIVHDQDFDKPERTELYVKMLIDEYEKNPTNTWCLWFLVYHYFKSENLEMFIKTGCDYIKYHTKREEKNYIETRETLKNMMLHDDTPVHLKDYIKLLFL